MNRQEALQKIAALAAEHGIGAEEIARALNAPRAGEPDAEKKSGGVVAKLFSYLGGTLVFAGIAAYIGMFWDGMGSLTRVLITFGPGFACFVLAAIAMRDKPNYSRAIPPLLIISGLLQPGGILVAIHEWFNYGGDWRYAALAVSAYMFLQQFLTFRAAPHAILLFFAAAYGFYGAFTIMDLLGMSWELTGLSIGFSMLCVARAMDKTEFRRMAAFGYLVGGAMFLFSLFDICEGGPLELAYLAASCFMVYLSVSWQSTAMLIVGVLSMLSYIGYFTAKHFIDSVGWPVALILMGMLFIGVSTGAWKFKRKYIRA